MVQDRDERYQRLDRLTDGLVVTAPATGMEEQRTFFIIVIVTLLLAAGFLIFLRSKARMRRQKAALQGGGTDSAFQGDIAESSISEVLEFIEMGKKTGCLQIESESPLGILFFQQGRIVHAAAVDGMRGRDAVNYALGLKAGNFKFLLDKQPKVRDVNLSTLEVLMEWSKAADEARRS